MRLPTAVIAMRRQSCCGGRWQRPYTATTAVTFSLETQGKPVIHGSSTEKTVEIYQASGGGEFAQAQTSHLSPGHREQDADVSFVY